MILVTGAAGKTGLTIIRALSSRGHAVRALVRREEQIEKVASAGASEWTAGDMGSSATLARALQDIRSIYHICPNVSPDEVAIGQTMITAARAAQVEHFVYHSVLHPQVEAMPHHWNKMHVEAMLLESGLAHTILQPASYELAGPEVLTPTDVAETLTRRLDRTVRVVEIGRDAWAERARASGLGAYQIDALVKMFTYYEQFGFWGNPRVLRSLLGRSPATFGEFVERVARVGRSDRG